MMKKISHEEITKELVAIVKQLLEESGQPYQREIKLDVSLSRHLGIDSLGRAELFQRIEKAFDVTIPDRLLAEAETLNDIAVYLQDTVSHIKIKSKPSIITYHGEKSTVDPLKANTLNDILLMYGEQSPSKPHLYFQREDGQEEVVTYGQLLKSSLQVAEGLIALGLKPGETVAIMQPTQPGFFYTFLGTLLAGGIPVPIYPPFRAHMLESYAKTEAKILRNAQVRILVTFDLAETLSRLLQQFVPSLKSVTTLDALLKSKALITPYPAKADNFAFIQYTSGSTSDPKGVLLNHYNLLSNIRAYGKGIRVTSSDVAVSWLPLYHDLGLIGMWLGSLYYGIPLILMTPFSFLNRPERWLWAIHYHRGTLSGAPNFAYELCVRKVKPEVIEGLDLSSWRMAANGAEKVYPRTLNQFAEKFAPYGFKRTALLPVYGLAESTVGLVLPPLDREFRVDDVDRKKFEEESLAVPSASKDVLDFVSCGLPLEGHAIRIVDDNNRELPERHVGNLQFRGPSSMQGYFNNPTATKAIYHDGWWDTGDLAYIADKELFVTGRRKDLIIKAGRNLYPAEIEELIGNVSGLRRGCITAFGITDAKRGTEQLIVVAETREKDKSKRDQIIDDIKQVMATTLDIIPDYIALVPPHSVPKTSSGKLQRAKTKTLYIEGHLGKTHVPTWLQLAKLGMQAIMRKTMNVLGALAKCIYTLYVMLLVLITILPMYAVMLVANTNFAGKACRIWLKGLRILIFCPLTVDGIENIHKASPVIFASNHASYVDGIVLLGLLPLHTRFVGKKELFSTPIIRTFMRKLEFLSIDRMDLSKGLEDTKHIEDTLKEGHSVVIFPEGTFGYAAGLRPFRLGAFKIAADANVPICPIALKGTRYILRDDEKLLSPSSVTVTVCEPIKSQGSEWQDVTQLRNDVRAEIAKYCGEPSLDFIAAQTVAAKIPKMKQDE